MSLPPVDEAAMADIDMDLDKTADHQAHDFHSDHEPPNIWALPDDQTASTAITQDDAQAAQEEELERPSLLRRLRDRRKKNETDHNPKSDKSSIFDDEDPQNNSSGT